MSLEGVPNQNRPQEGRRLETLKIGTVVRWTEEQEDFAAIQGRKHLH